MKLVVSLSHWLQEQRAAPWPAHPARPFQANPLASSCHKACASCYITYKMRNTFANINLQARF